MLIYIGLITTLLLIMNAAVLYVLLSLNSEKLKDKADRKTDEEVERAMSEREKREATLMDEGFDNIMRYTVNGITGFEIDER